MLKAILENASGAILEVFVFIIGGIILIDRLQQKLLAISERIAAVETWKDRHMNDEKPHIPCIREQEQAKNEDAEIDGLKADIKHVEERLEKRIDKIEGSLGEKIDTMQANLFKMLSAKA